ncbi:MAG: ABC transporter ATP-binding protein/permease, partial [Anaerolineae bacterium]|nr:ABC transporter ATP-binding protein/permease [Anaerolineae bacterium]
MMLDGGRRLMEQETSRPQNPAATLARFWPYFRPRAYALLLVVIFMTFSAWTQVRTPELVGEAVDCYLVVSDNCSHTTPNPNASVSERIEGMGEITLQLVILFLLGSVAVGLMFFTMTWAGSYAIRGLLVDAFHQTNRLSLGYYTRNETGDIMSRFTSDAETIQQTIRFALVQVLSGIVVIGWIIYKMLEMNVPYALLSMSVMPFMMIATVYFSGQARKAYRRSRQEMGSVNANLQENIAGVREAQAFSREGENIERFRETNAANRDANIRAAAYTSALTPVLEALGYVAIAIVVVVGGLSILRNEALFGTQVISLGIVVAFLQYVQRFNQPITQIALMWTNLQSAVAGGERIFNLLDEQPDLVDKPNAQPMPPIRGKVEFMDVVAGYEDGQPVLKGINFTAEQGQMIAIVGPTGAGKTTLINLIPRFYDVTEGAV